MRIFELNFTDESCLILEDISDAISDSAFSDLDKFELLYLVGQELRWRYDVTSSLVGIFFIEEDYMRTHRFSGAE